MNSIHTRTNLQLGGWFYTSYWTKSLQQGDSQCDRAGEAKPHASAKCKSVQKPHANLPDIPVALTSASKYFTMLPGPAGALQSALRHCKSILRCPWKHLQSWRCIQDATRMDYEDSQILEQVRPLHGSVGDFESSWDCCTAVRDTWCCILQALVPRVP